jgi:hypothetical protein
MISLDRFQNINQRRMKIWFASGAETYAQNTGEKGFSETLE